MGHAVEVKGDELWRSLKAFQRTLPEDRSAKASVSLSDGFLAIAAEDTVVEIPAVGEWDGFVEIPVFNVASLGNEPQTGESISIRVDGERFRIGAWSVKCTVHANSPAPDLTPPRPRESEISLMLYLWLTEPPERLEWLGYSARIRDAKAFGRSALASAHAALVEFGVAKEDLAELMEASIRKKHSPPEDGE